MRGKGDAATCAECGKECRVQRIEWSRAAKPRCNCGGRLEASEEARDRHAAIADAGRILSRGRTRRGYVVA